jgi:hypothetical protein
MSAYRWTPLALLHLEFADLAGILILLREGGGVARKRRDMHSRLREFSFLHPHPCELYTLRLSPSLSVVSWMDVGRMSRCIHRRTTELSFHSAFDYYCLYLPGDYIETSSIPPCTTRIIVGCSWLLVVVVELFVVVGMWLCLTTIIFSTFLL